MGDQYLTWEIDSADQTTLGFSLSLYSVFFLIMYLIEIHRRLMLDIAFKHQKFMPLGQSGHNFYSLGLLDVDSRSS